MNIYSTDELYAVLDYNENKIVKVFTNESDAKLEYDKIRNEKSKLFRPYFTFLTDDEFDIHFNMLRTVDVMTLEQAIDLIVEYAEESAVAPYMDESY